MVHLYDSPARDVLVSAFGNFAKHGGVCRLQVSEHNTGTREGGVKAVRIIHRIPILMRV
jgi:hypothetical protein